jgi:putative acetyltransferase
MIIREADTGELPEVLSILQAAFGRADEAELTEALLSDGSAEPRLSLLAFEAGKPVGHILFTNVTIEPAVPFRAALLAPLSVRPEAQRKGVGKALVRYGLQELADAGVDAVFVLGHTSYYPTMGFQPAGPMGYDMPFPFPDGAPDAWMMRPIRPNIPDGLKGNVVVPDALNKLEYWRE